MAAFINGIWPKVLAFLAAAGAVLAVVAMIRKGGADAERVAQGHRQAEIKRRGDEVDNRVNSAGDAELERLRNKWTRP